MDSIFIKGARTHNLKNISLEIPRNKIIVITGLSGSGKSSLAFDTLYAEGQRRRVGLNSGQYCGLGLNSGQYCGLGLNSGQYCCGAWGATVRGTNPRLARVPSTYSTRRPGGKPPCASGTYSAREAGTRSQYVPHRGPWRECQLRSARADRCAQWAIRDRSPGHG